MNIRDFLAPEYVQIDQAVRDKGQLIDRLAAEFAKTSGLEERTIAQALSAREKLGSTGLGGGIAIPHARVSGLRTPVARIFRLRKPIDFDAVDDQAVDVVIALLLPEGPDPTNLTCLATVSRRLRDRDLVRRVRAAKDAAAVYNLIAA